MMRLPWYGRTVPHAVLDILRGCNCRCRECYNAGRTVDCKSLEALRAELAILRRARNLQAVSLSGGEPLMHPQILEIIDWLHREEKVTVASLTNGILFTDELAPKLAAAGLKMISFHMQTGQIRPDATDETVRDLLREKGRLARAHGIAPAMVETVAAADGAGFTRMAQFFRAAPEFEYALVTVARKFEDIRSDRAQQDVPCEPFLTALDAAGFSPSVFVGGRIHRDNPRWYIFQSVQALDAAGNERAWNRTRPSLLERTFLWGLAVFAHRSLHWVVTTSAKLKVRLLLNGLLGGHLSTFFFAVRAICAGWTLREKHIIVQLPPYSLGDGRIEFCDQCPDATARNGRVHPLCLGDLKEEVPL